MTKIRNTLNSWRFRYLTPLGKITVIKSLALSKLTHLSLIIPTLQPHIIVNLEKMIYSFLWDNKPNKIAKLDVVLPLNRGGLKMVSVLEFWKSLKISWIRRLSHSKSFWVEILNYELSKNNFTVNDIFLMGNTGISKLAGKCLNPFWKECFTSTSDLIDNSYFLYPKKFALYPIVENSLFKIANLNVTRNVLGGRLDIQVSDTLCEHENKFLNLETFNLKNNMNMNFLTFESLKDSIRVGARKLNFNISLSEIQQRPKPTLLYSLVTSAKTGCGDFYKIFISKQVFSQNTSKIELKWQTELGRTNSIDCWNGRWQLFSKIKYQNEIKWLQCRIMRRCLGTNKIVSKFVNNVNANCSFCQETLETLTHLFFNCTHVQDFWNDLKHFLNTLEYNFIFSLEFVIFGNISSSSESAENLIYLFGKKYIWNCKYKSLRPILIGFKHFLRHNLNSLCIIFQIKDEYDSYLARWEIIYNALNNI